MGGFKKKKSCWVATEIVRLELKYCLHLLDHHQRRHRNSNCWLTFRDSPAWCFNPSLWYCSSWWEENSSGPKEYIAAVMRACKMLEQLHWFDIFRPIKSFLIASALPIPPLLLSQLSRQWNKNSRQALSCAETPFQICNLWIPSHAYGLPCSGVINTPKNAETLRAAAVAGAAYLFRSLSRRWQEMVSTLIGTSVT